MQLVRLPLEGILTVILLSSVILPETHCLPSVNQAFTIKAEEKVSCFPCSPMYSKTGDVNGMCIQTREFAYWIPPLRFIRLTLPCCLICIYSPAKLFPDASLTWTVGRVITVREMVLWMNEPLAVICVLISLSSLLFNIQSSHLVCALLEEAP